MLTKGTRIADYLIARSAVVVGAMSEVYEAHAVTGGAPVAVKVLRSHWCPHQEVTARFLNEGETLRTLQHPHLVRALATGVHSDNRPYMVLEWMPEDLERALKREGGHLSEGDCTQVVRQLAQVLAMLHARGIIHRDLKPANVLVAQRAPGAWRIVLADLGLAKRLVTDKAPGAGLLVSTAGDALMGTGEYMPPEQWDSAKHVDDRADVYSLGVLAFELLAGRLPFIAHKNQSLMAYHVLDDPPLELLDGRASPEVRALLARMLEKTPADRPSMTDVLSLWPVASG